MKILINGYYKFLPKKKATFSGPRNLLESFLKHLDTHGHSYTAFVLMGKKIRDSKVTSRRIHVNSGKSSWLISKLRLNTPDVSAAKKPGIPASLSAPLQRITRIIEKENPDIVFINGMSIANWFILKAASNLKIPVIVNHLGLWFKEIISYGVSPAGIKIMREMEKDLVRLSSKNIFLSKLSLAHLDKFLICVPREKIELIPNPVDEVYFKNITKPPQKNLLKIGVVARWDPIKNHEAVLKLAKAARKQNLPWEFYSVTTINKGYAWYKSMEREYAEYINILPPMIPAELKRFYQSMNILILPSRFDVSPTVVMEALMQNRSTIISPTVGLVDVYKENGASDMIVNFSKTDLVIKAIKKFGHKSPPKRLFNYVRKNYRGAHVYSEYMRVIKSLVK